MKAVLTEKLLQSLTSKGAPHAPIWDQKLKGFGIRIGEAGGISFFAMGRLRGKGGQPIRFTIGRYPKIELGDARERARELLRDLHFGTDPRERKAEQAKAEAAKKKTIYRNVAEEFCTRYLTRKRTGHAIELRIRRELVARWGDRPIADITRADVVAMVEEIIDRGHREAARQTFTFGRRLHNWAITRGTYGLETSPFDRLDTVDLFGRKQPRKRILSPDEMRLIWRATEGVPHEVYPDGQYVRLLLLLGVRRNELARARRSEFDLDAARWTIPADRMKADEDKRQAEEHVVPLPPVAVKILRAMPTFAGTEFVFTAKGNKALNDFGAVKRRLDRRITALNGGVPIPSWCFHDCRRVFRSGLSSVGVLPHIAELCLAHKQTGLAKVYDLHSFEPEKRKALARWAAHLMAIVEGPPAKVIRLREVAA